MIVKLDHIVLTVASIAATREFYARALGFEARVVEGRTALHFGPHKVNLHEVGHEFSPRATLAKPGTGDFCLIADEPVAAVKSRLEAAGIAVEEGPVERSGAVHRLTSIYFRDPDGNLVEVSNEIADG